MEKQKKIVSMFDNIAKTYDLANRILSFGIDKSWRKQGCNLAFYHYDKKSIAKIVDVATGTGDMMSYWDKIAKKQNIEIKKLIGIDPSIGMVEIGKKKFPNFEFQISSATELNLENDSIDIISISYGIRNVVERQKAWNEFYKKLKNNGLVVILEFTKRPNENFISKIRDFYMKVLLPKVGGFISKNREAYEYLPNSIDNFIDSDKMILELKEAGFKVLENRSFSMGISSLFIAKKEQ
jgi:demethylmenaquinone methyltransferase/2-methoxy-6-polyprenyl-1,4-benzoquinol methylase